MIYLFIDRLHFKSIVLSLIMILLFLLNTVVAVPGSEARNNGPATAQNLQETDVSRSTGFGFSENILATTTTATPELTVGNASGAPGAVLQVPVNLTSSGEVVAIQFDLGYDPALLTYQQTNAGSLTSTFTVYANDVPGNKIRVIIMDFSNKPIASGSGTVAQLQFQVAATPAGQTCMIELSGVTLSDTQGNLITTNVHNGQFTLLQPPGDMNGDYTVNFLDLLFMTQYLGEPLTGDSLRADFNKDDVVNILDLLEVKKLY
ncbi:MAG: Cohesin domain protein [Pelotomaculum sp. PtaB.Bin104]|nr:MAG: Cohesin domain protein [Pelotomaculum sp. PtaB.Bin104]